MSFTVHPHGFWSRDVQAADHTCSKHLAAWLATYLDRSRRTYDFGCGRGSYLLALAGAGFNPADLIGYEGDPPAVRDWGIVKPHDLTQPLMVYPSGNVICLEVAEHVPAEYESTLLDTLDAACHDRLVLSWARRGQGGTGHVNCRDEEEVVPRLERYGFRLDAPATAKARSEGGQDLEWFLRTVMCFRRKER